MNRLRVVDDGEVDALRSQALWHGIASSMEETTPVTLSFCRPTEPYVGIGFHRSLDELDMGRCTARGLPVIRRRIGGGPVYVDSDQLFFQLTLPARSAPARVDRLYELCLQPAVEAFRRLGLAAEMRGLNDIAVGERKISGTGAGRIGDGVTVVGNVIFRFPHDRMAEVLALPSHSMRAECLRLMRRHVSSLEGEGLAAVGADGARQSLVECYSDAFGARVEPAALSTTEERAIDGWARRFSGADWLAGASAVRRPGRMVKVSATAWVWAARDEALALEMSIVAAKIERLRIEAASLNGDKGLIESTLEGVSAEAAVVRQRLIPFGDTGRRIEHLLVPGLAVH